MNDLHYTNIMIEFEKLTARLDKLEKEVAQFKQLVYPQKHKKSNVVEFEPKFLNEQELTLAIAADLGGC